jgi:hypothetical protein
MGQGEASIPGVARSDFLKRISTPSSSNFPAMESQKGKGKRRSEDMLSMSILF